MPDSGILIGTEGEDIMIRYPLRSMLQSGYFSSTWIFEYTKGITAQGVTQISKVGIYAKVFTVKVPRPDSSDILNGQYSLFMVLEL